MKSVRILAIPWLALVFTACSTVPKTPADISHTHAIPHVVSLGGEQRHFHVVMKYDSKEGDITIRFFDANEQPYKALVDQWVKAELTVQGQHPKIFHFRNLRAGLSHYPSGKNVYWTYARTTHIDAIEPWLKDLPAFEVKAWLPIDGYVYEASFVYPEK